MTWSHAVWLALAIAACGQPSTPVAPTPPPSAPPPDAAVPLPLDRDLPALARRATQLYVETARAFADAGDDCAAATARLSELQATHADVIAANAQVLHEGRARELRVALEPHAAELDAAAKAIVESPTMSACAQDAAFADALDRLVGAPP